MKKQLGSFSFSKLQLMLGFILALIASHCLQRYILFDIEQTRVFVYEAARIKEQVAQAGGLADMIALFLQQFFVLPFAGPAIMALVYTIVALCIQKTYSAVVERECSMAELILCWIPSCLLFAYTEDDIFFTSGHIAIMLSSVGLCIYACLLTKAHKVVRWILTPIIILAFGYACSTHVWPMIAGMFIVALAKKDWLNLVIVPVSAALMLGLARYFSLAVTNTELFSPDVYTYRNRIESIMAEVWISLVFLMFIALLLKRYELPKFLNGKVGAVAVAIVLGIIAKVAYSAETSESTKVRMELQYHLDNGNTQEAYEICSAHFDNYCNVNILCWLEYKDGGSLLNIVNNLGIEEPDMLIMKQSPIRFVRRHLMTHNYNIGYVMGAQHEAFEYNEPTEGMMNPEAVKILAKTNIIIGAYAVAEKYISHLEKTLFYRSWAKEQREYLYNDAKVEADPEYGPRRKGFKIQSIPEDWTTAYHIVRQIAEASPELPAKDYYEAFKEMGLYRNLEQKGEWK